ncbi:gustatory and odorant receptor 22-like isoform X2 [Photinus pyralis]|uniref:gustatory and odorant receptor 22-like isoform X2 n=1 Tax=Photinus pyralis TaxID=7054 RepID=UPI0012670F80|nr:gustatory and odorant receptor 22-like isoform X2 [Photinus pyralis]
METFPSFYKDDFHIPTIGKQPRGSARAQEIYKRSLLKSSDGQTLDDHDQFYRDHKLLLKLFQVLGAMPIQRGEIGRITFGWFSVPSIYAYGVYLVTTVLVFFVGYDRLLILTTKSKKFDEYIYSIIFLMYLVPHFWVPFTGWSVAKEVADYKNSWGPFQLDYYKIAGKNLEFPHLNILIVITSSGCLILAVVFLLTLSALMEGFTLYHTIAYYHIITTLNMNAALWFINCRAIGDASRGVASSFEKIYGYTSEIVDHGFRLTFREVGLLVDAAYCTTLLFVFCDCSHRASINISNRVQHRLMSVKMDTVDVHTANEIELFLVAIRVNSPKVSLKGYTTVNRELISSMLATMMMYLIVLLQFKISLVRSS